MNLKVHLTLEVKAKHWLFGNDVHIAIKEIAIPKVLVKLIKNFHDEFQTKYREKN